MIHFLKAHSFLVYTAGFCFFFIIFRNNGGMKNKVLCLKRLDSDFNFLMLTRIVLTQLGGHCKYHCGDYN